MKQALLGLGLAVSIAASAPVHAARQGCAGPACDGTLLLVGTHGSGPGQGIFAVKLDPRTGGLTALGLAAEIDRPTWLARDPDRPLVYSVSETGNDGKTQGGVYSLAVDRGTGRLSIRSRQDSGGGGATNLTYDRRLHTVFVANYGTGQVAALPVEADGRLDAAVSVVNNTGSGPNKRQAGPHAHGVAVDPSGQYLLSPDLGADKVFVYRWDGKARALVPAATPWTAFPAGSGPRHLVFSPDGRFAFVDTELTGEVHAFRWNARTGVMLPVSHVALDAPDFPGARSAAELATSADGRFLYVSNRGANLLHVFAVDPARGTLTEVQRIDCGGQSPWSFGIDPTGKWLVVTNEASGNLATFAIDRRSGRLAATGSTVAMARPVALTFVP